MKFRFGFNFAFSPFIKRFIVADALLFGGWGFVDPIFSIFIVREIPGASLVTVGITVAIYWIAKSIIQVPIAVFLDKTDGEKDDFYTLIASLVVVSIGAFSMPRASHVWQVYLAQLVKAIGFAMYVASGPVIFSRHLDPGHNALDWSMDSTSVGLAMGVSGFFAGIIATWLGYDAVFLLAGIFGLISAIVLSAAGRFILPPRSRPGRSVLRDHAPVNINQ